MLSFSVKNGQMTMKIGMKTSSGTESSIIVLFGFKIDRSFINYLCKRHSVIIVSNMENGNESGREKCYGNISFT